MVSKNLILSFTDKKSTGIYSLVLFMLNVAPVSCVASTGLSPPTSSVLDISQMLQL